MKTVVRAGILGFLVSLIAADAAWAAEKYILATGRRDQRIYAIDLTIFAGSPIGVPSRRSGRTLDRLTMAFGVLLFLGLRAALKSIA